MEQSVKKKKRRFGQRPDAPRPPIPLEPPRPRRSRPPPQEPAPQEAASDMREFVSALQHNSDALWTASTLPTADDDVPPLESPSDSEDDSTPLGRRSRTLFRQGESAELIERRNYQRMWAEDGYAPSGREMGPGQRWDITEGERWETGWVGIPVRPLGEEQRWERELEQPQEREQRREREQEQRAANFALRKFTMSKMGHYELVEFLRDKRAQEEQEQREVRAQRQRRAELRANRVFNDINAVEYIDID
ncbi:hypothetical protein C8R46DRAFT_1221675 [Mycena filopes]|nr:hypothetical protein C8R46DRAFT_1221675 [Mycena filopes]